MTSSALFTIVYSTYAIRHGTPLAKAARLHRATTPSHSLDIQAALATLERSLERQTREPGYATAIAIIREAHPTALYKELLL